MFSDVTRACFHTLAKRELCVGLLAENAGYQYVGTGAPAELALLFLPLCLCVVLLPACPYACLCGPWVGFEGWGSLGLGSLVFRVFWV